MWYSNPISQIPQKEGRRERKGGELEHFVKSTLKLWINLMVAV